MFDSFLSGLFCSEYMTVFLLSRLLDASAVPLDSTLDLTLVLEYIDQDLSTYLSKVPAAGLSRGSVKV